jgi:mannose-binding lectin 2
MDMFRCAALVLVASVAHAFTTVREQSIIGPFTSFDADGMRIVPGWRLGGHASAQENFLRLTNDRASKRSNVWSETKSTSEEWSATLRFRVSGQGKKLFGDGLAFWYTANDRHKDGPLHGFTDTFKGFGIVLDTCVPLASARDAGGARSQIVYTPPPAHAHASPTHAPPRYVNNEPGHTHKDVQIVVSDGSAAKALDANPVGCDADFRFWEGRDDFSVTRHAVLRVRYRNAAVSAWIDAKADNNWKTCFENVVVPGMEAWDHEGAWLGITATTGDLADNHDVLSLVVGPEDEVAPNPSTADVRPELFKTGNEETDKAINSAIAVETYLLQERIVTLEHKLEYELAALEDGLKTTLKKMAEADRDSIKRLDALEERLSGKVSTQVEGAIDSKLTTRLATLEQKLAESASQKVSELRTAISSHGQTWMLPFAGLGVVILILACVGWRTHFAVTKMQKTHLL